MLSGRTIAITGAASGIGRETARLALASDAKVIAIDRNEPDIEVSSFFQADLSRKDSIDALVEKLPQGLDGLANIAGLPPPIRRRPC